jgi:asparagine synthase (glutamine-hydrolysing)
MEILTKAASANGVDVLFPFMDVRLVEFCVALPANQKMRNGVTRLVMRNAMRGILAESVRRRLTKAHYDHNFAKVLFENNPDIPAQPEDLENAVKFIDQPTFAKLCAINQENEKATDTAIDVWDGLCLIFWLQNMDNKEIPSQDGTICAIL